MKIHHLSTILILLLMSSPVFSQEQPHFHWKFESENNRNVIELVNQASDTIEGNFRFMRGIEGNAIKLDGFTTAIRHQPSGTDNLSGSFSTEAWVAIAAYPWNWCPVIAQQDHNDNGFSFGIGPRGEIGFQMNIGSNVITCISDEKIPLRNWSHIAAVYDEGKGLEIYLNGTLAGKYETTGRPRFAPKEEVRIGMNYTAVKPSNQIGDVGNKDYWYSLDAIIDELKVYNNAIDQSHFKQQFAANTPLPSSNLERRVMPRGPETEEGFKAYYTHLNYYQEWDAQWPVDNDPDVFVTFRDTPVRMIFWRGTRYSPAWVTDKDQWMCDQSVEAWNGAEGCFEHMQDRHCRYSHVRIIEDTDARKVIHWRYAPVSAYNNLWREDEKTGWAVWVDEYYFIYPDATAIRKVSWKKGALGYPRQFQESLPLTNPEQLQGDVLEADYLAIANMEGEIQHYEYLEDVSQAEEKKVPESPNIQQHNFKSPYDPFIIFEPGNRMNYIKDRDISSFNHPGTCNHWPVGQAYCDGRITQATDRPSHFLGFPISAPVINEKGDRYIINSIYGMKELDIEELVEISRSWATAPDLSITENKGDFSGGEYQMSEKAYVLEKKQSSKAGKVSFGIQASDKKPLINPAIVINNWGDADATVKLNNKALRKGKDYFTGHVSRVEGTRLVIWLETKTTEGVNISIEKL